MNGGEIAILSFLLFRWRNKEDWPEGSVIYILVTFQTGTVSQNIDDVELKKLNHLLLFLNPEMLRHQVVNVKIWKFLEHWTVLLFDVCWGEINLKKGFSDRGITWTARLEFGQSSESLSHHSSYPAVLLAVLNPFQLHLYLVVTCDFQPVPRKGERILNISTKLNCVINTANWRMRALIG